MKSRESLIRLKKFHVDEKRRQVTQIQSMIDEFNRMIQDLDNQVNAEQARTGIADVSHFAYSTYAKSALERRNNLTTSIGELQKQLEDAQDVLAEAVEDLKKVEIIEERNQEKSRAAEDAREQADLDELAINMKARSA
jgi:flagellar export protein FliJ